MFSMSRRHLILGSLSTGAAVGFQFLDAIAQVRPGTLLSGLALYDKRIDDIAAFPDGSFALSFRGVDKAFSRVATRHDADGTVLWQTELGEDEHYNVVRSIVPAVGDSEEGLYVSSGFRKVWRLRTDGSLHWEKDLFDHAGMYCPQAMVGHPSGGVLVAGVARRPTEELGVCQNCAIVRLAEDGSPRWTWWRDHAWHAFVTTLVVTGQGIVIAHMTSYNPATGSLGDHCAEPLHAQWTAWIDPDGRTIRAVPWPPARRGEAMALDSAGRLIFYGRTRPELRNFFRVCDAETGNVLREHVFGEPEPDIRQRDWYLPSPRPMDVSNRGVSVALVSSCAGSDGEGGMDVYSLAPEGQLDRTFLPGVCWVGPRAVVPDGTALLAADWRQLIRIPLP